MEVGGVCEGVAGKADQRWMRWWVDVIGLVKAGGTAGVWVNGRRVG